ncbi:DUF3908 family protein [Paenibacillus thermotolerans]|uniref:DUF3908 family protein n=1 Tax=Paenibacillus thermotolerans TaxID=3027807 RepID=UPI002368AC6A|nr:MULTISPECIES: DUF3908 family protein [unclassified Paenibacillus]
MEMNYRGFVDHAVQKSFYGQTTIGLLSEVLKEYVNEDDVKVFYPKNLFVENTNIELYAFMQDHVIAIIQGDNGIILKSLYYKNIRNIELFKSTRNESEVGLLIRYTNEEEINLRSHQDTNDTWAFRYGKKIKEIFKMLSNPQ